MKSLIILIFAITVLNACDKQEEDIELPLRLVKHQTLSHSTDNIVKTFSGITKAELEADLSFRVAGRVEAIPVKVGDELSKNQLVARLDNRDYLVLHEQAKAELASAKASLRSAESEYDRTIGLYEKRNASKSQLDTGRANAESAKAQVTATSQQVETARLQLSYTNLYSPRDCVVSSIPVKENENILSGQAVAKVNCGKKIEVEVDVPESYIDSVRAGQQVNVSLSATNGQVYSGKVTEISSGSSDQVSSFPVTIVLDGNHPSLRAGMAAEVQFTKDSTLNKKFFILPVNAVAHDADGEFVFILQKGNENKQGIVHKKYINVDEIVQKGVRVSEGLSEGEIIITAGVTVIRDGMSVLYE